jgi:subtilisin
MRTAKLLLVFVICAAVSTLWYGCGSAGSGSSGPANVSADSAGGAGSVRRIVVFQDDFTNHAAQEALVRRFGQDLKTLELVNGMAVLLPGNAVASLAREPGVLRIDVDAQVHALGRPEGRGKPAPPPPPPAQVLPWGVDRIDADFAWPAGHTGSGVKVAVIDTGIDQDHPDLVANIAGGANFVSRGLKPADATKWDDDNGHGTHVAGIIAAANNSIGVVGVAPEARLYGVKVLDKNGSGYVSDVIAGIGWCKDNGIQAANMSLGSNSDVQSLHDACDVAKAAGVLLVAAAGNDGGAVDYPAAYSSVVAVAAVDRNDSRPSWSSYGPQILVAAPGVDVYSTWKGGGYATASGTSMAAPHVTGTLALNLSASLSGTADDLPPGGWDQYTGYGLVDAGEAATGVLNGGNNLSDAGVSIALAWPIYRAAG